MNDLHVVPVVMDLHMPAGILGRGAVVYDVRAFLLPRDDGVTLIDTGLDPDAGAITMALDTLGAHWSDITDVILTHGHVDHVGGLATVIDRAPSATVWAGRGDTFTVPVRRVGDGDAIRGLRVITTPGHTPGHLSLLQEQHKVLFVGDVVGNMHGHLVMAPEQFTDDAAWSLLSLRMLATLDVERLILSHGEELGNPTTALKELLESIDDA